MLLIGDTNPEFQTTYFKLDHQDVEVCDDGSVFIDTTNVITGIDTSIDDLAKLVNEARKWRVRRAIFLGGSR